MQEKQLTHMRLITIAATALAALLSIPASAQSIRWLGVLPNGVSSKAYDVSDDGEVVVGEADRFTRTRAFRWTSGNGMQDLGSFRDDSPIGGSSVAFGVSPSGLVVVGYSETNASFVVAFGWPNPRNNGLINLGTLGGNNSIAYDVTTTQARQAAYAIGWAENANQQRRAFRLEVSRAAQTIQDLGTLGGSWSEAHALTPDGQIVVGYSETFDGSIRAFRWTASTDSMENLGVPRGSTRSLAYGVSADGQVVVGTAKDEVGHRRPFRYDRGGMSLLPTPNDAEGEAYDVNRDGSVIVGWSSYANDQKRAFRWVNEQGEDLNITYGALLNGSILNVAHAVSSDGRYIVGYGFNSVTNRTEAFLLDTGDNSGGCTPNNGDVDNTGCVDDADLLAVLFAFGQTGSELGRVDTNCDGTIDDADLLIVLFNFGSGC